MKNYRNKTNYVKVITETIGIILMILAAIALITCLLTHQMHTPGQMDIPWVSFMSLIPLTGLMGINLVIYESFK